MLPEAPAPGIHQLLWAFQQLLLALFFLFFLFFFFFSCPFLVLFWFFSRLHATGLTFANSSKFVIEAVEVWNEIL